MRPMTQAEAQAWLERHDYCASRIDTGSGRLLWCVWPPKANNPHVSEPGPRVAEDGSWGLTLEDAVTHARDRVTAYFKVVIRKDNEQRWILVGKDRDIAREKKLWLRETWDTLRVVRVLNKDRVG